MEFSLTLALNLILGLPEWLAWECNNNEDALRIFKLAATEGASVNGLIDCLIDFPIVPKTRPPEYGYMLRSRIKFMRESIGETKKRMRNPRAHPPVSNIGDQLAFKERHLKKLLQVAMELGINIK